MNWWEIRDTIRNEWRETLIEELTLQLDQDAVLAARDDIASTLQEWFLNNQDEILASEVAALNVISLLELLALHADDSKALLMLKAFLNHPVKEVAELAKLGFTQVEYLLNRKGLSHQQLQERGLAEALSRWLSNSN